MIKIGCGMLMLYVGNLTEVTCVVYVECSVEMKLLKMSVYKRIDFVVFFLQVWNVLSLVENNVELNVDI